MAASLGKAFVKAFVKVNKQWKALAALFGYQRSSIAHTRPW
jgi:hypothetical protein